MTIYAKNLTFYPDPLKSIDHFRDMKTKQTYTSEEMTRYCTDFANLWLNEHADFSAFLLAESEWLAGLNLEAQFTAFVDINFETIKRCWELTDGASIRPAYEFNGAYRF